MYDTDIFRYQADYFAYRNSKFKKSLESKYGVYTPATEKQEGVEKYRSKGYTYCNYNKNEMSLRKPYLNYFLVIYKTHSIDFHYNYLFDFP